MKTSDADSLIAHAHAEFAALFAEAQAAGEPDPTAMTIAIRGGSCSSSVQHSPGPCRRYFLGGFREKLGVR